MGLLPPSLLQPSNAHAPLTTRPQGSGTAAPEGGTPVAVRRGKVRVGAAVHRHNTPEPAPKTKRSAACQDATAERAFPPHFFSAFVWSVTFGEGLMRAAPAACRKEPIPRIPSLQTSPSSLSHASFAMADESKSSGSEATFRRIVVTEFGGPEVLTLATATASGLAPADGQVLVHIAYAGVNPVDTCTCRELSSQALAGNELRTCQFTRVMRHSRHAAAARAPLARYSHRNVRAQAGPSVHSRHRRCGDCTGSGAGRVPCEGA